MVLVVVVLALTGCTDAATFRHFLVRTSILCRIALHAEECNGLTVNEQLDEAGSTGARPAPEVRARATSADTIDISFGTEPQEHRLARMP